MHGLSKFYTKFLAFLICMHGPLPQATQSTTVNHRRHIKFVPPVSSLLLLVEVQTRATRTWTSVIFAPGLRCCVLTPPLAFTCFTRYRCSWNIWRSVHSRIHTRVRNAVTLVWGSLGLTPITDNSDCPSIHFILKQPLNSGHPATLYNVYSTTPI